MKLRECILLLPLGWLISFLASRSTLGTLTEGRHEWLSYHTLISMRAFEQWGFWKLMGASIVASKSFEYNDFDIRQLTKGDGLYLSYPSLWLDIPYMVFKVLGLDISVLNLQLYSLVLNRYVLSLILLLLYRGILRSIFSLNQGNSYSLSCKINVASLLGVMSWLITVPVLHWSQNIYFTDQAVILPIALIFLFIACRRYTLNNMSWLEQFILLILSFLALGFDWYGWTFLVTVILIHFILSCRAGYCWRKAVSDTWPIFVGMLLVGIFYLIQLLYYHDGFNQILKTGLYRSIANSPQLHKFFGKTARRSIAYFSWILPAHLTHRRTILLIISITFTVLNVYLLRKSFINKNMVACATCLLFVAPLVHNLIFANHSYIHDFSLFKFSIFFTFLSVVLPSMTILVTSAGRYFWSLLLITYVLAVGILHAPREFYLYSGRFFVSNFPEQFGTLVRNEFSSNQIPFSKNFVYGPFPPHGLWYSNRRIYDVSKFEEVVGTFGLKSKDVEYYFIDRKTESLIQKFCDNGSMIKERRLEITRGDGQKGLEDLIVCKLRHGTNSDSWSTSSPHLSLRGTPGLHQRSG